MCLFRCAAPYVMYQTKCTFSWIYIIILCSNNICIILWSEKFYEIMMLNLYKCAITIIKNINTFFFFHQMNVSINFYIFVRAAFIAWLFFPPHTNTDFDWNVDILPPVALRMRNIFAHNVHTMRFYCYKNILRAKLNGVFFRNKIRTTPVSQRMCIIYVPEIEHIEHRSSSSSSKRTFRFLPPRHTYCYMYVHLSLNNGKVKHITQLSTRP